jgi:hypothetical protein
MRAAGRVVLAVQAFRYAGGQARRRWAARHQPAAMNAHAESEGAASLLAFLWLFCTVADFLVAALQRLMTRQSLRWMTPRQASPQRMRRGHLH